jgi:HAD superfamily hydrolase (TIGR01509 family)
LQAVIFDFDGVLVDTEPLHFRSLRDALAPEGIHLTEAEYFKTLLAYDDHGAIRIAHESRGLALRPEERGRIARRKAEVFEALLPEVSFFPGVREFVRALAAEVPVAIASGALRDEIEAILAAGGLRDAFGAIVGADDVQNTKPHPEPYLRAVAELSPRLDPQACLAIEDSIPGIASARAAGMKVLGVTNSYPAEALNLAHRVVPSLEDVRPGDLRPLFEK